MVNFEYKESAVVQHILKYGVDIRPTVVIKSDKTRLTPVCEKLTNSLPEVFETVLSGPDRLLIQKSFVLGHGKKIEMPTLVFTERGPVFSFPIRMTLEETEEIGLSDLDRVFTKSLRELRHSLPGRKVVRVGVVHEMVFDCGTINSTDLIATALSKERWKIGLARAKLHLENPREGNNINVDIEPVIAQRVHVSGGQPGGAQNVGYGIAVMLDINNRDMSEDLSETQIQGILGFADSYASDELFAFLNDENGETTT